MNREKPLYKFKQLTQKSDANGTLRILTNNMRNRTLPLPDKT